MGWGVLRDGWDIFFNFFFNPSWLEDFKIFVRAAGVGVKWQLGHDGMGATLLHPLRKGRLLVHSASLCLLTL